MRKTFGIDLPKVIDKAIAKANGATAGQFVTSTGYGLVQWTHVEPTTRDPANQTAGLQPTTTMFNVRAKVSEIPLGFRASPLGEINVHAGDLRIEIYTNSITKGADGEPVALPDEDDYVTIGGIQRQIYFAPKTASNAKVVCYAR
jgi:hypothetical protein